MKSLLCLISLIEILFKAPYMKTWICCALLFFVTFQICAKSYPDLNAAKDHSYQKHLQDYVQSNGLAKLAKNKQLSFALVDITEPQMPRVAEVNGDINLYAASLPKIAILLGVFQQIHDGVLILDAALEEKLIQMIRFSSNSAASELLDLVGKEYLADLLQSEQYQLYDRENGGLWVGKHYSRAGAWKRDPLFNLSHGASSLKVAKFYYLLATDRLVSADSCSKMREILSDPGIKHKFVRGAEEHMPGATIYRKSGTWKTYHSDSALIEHGGRSYIAVALINHPKGDKILSDLLVAMDKIVFSSS